MIRSVADIRTCATKSGRCGTCTNIIFGSSLGGPGHTQIETSFSKQQQLVLRPILVAAANTRMNRFVGWGGLFWLASLLNTGALLNEWTPDLEYVKIRGTTLNG